MLEAQKNPETHGQDSLDPELLSANVKDYQDKIGESIEGSPEQLHEVLDDFLVASAGEIITDARKDGIVTYDEQVEINREVGGVIVHSAEHAPTDSHTPVDILSGDGYDEELVAVSGMLGRWKGVDLKKFTAEKIRSVREYRHERQVRKAASLLNDDTSEGSLKFEAMLSSGKIREDDERVQQMLVQIAVQRARAASSYDSDPDKGYYFRGVPAEHILSNRTAVDMLLDSFVDSANKELKTDYERYQIVNGLPLRSAPGLLSELLENPEYVERIIGQVDIQEYGTRALNYAMDTVLASDNFLSEENAQRREEITGNITTLLKLGFRPFDDAASFEMLLSGWRGEELQRNMNSLGLVEPAVVDRIYAEKFNSLKQSVEGRLNILSQQNPVGSGSEYRYRLSDAIPVDVQLEPTDQNQMANYWRDQSELLGEDAMELVFGVIAQSQAGRRIRPDLDELFTPEGMPTGALFYNNFDHHSDTVTPMGFVFEKSGRDIIKQEQQLRAMRYMAQNVDMIEGEYRGFVKAWERLEIYDSDRWAVFASISQMGPRLRGDIFDADGTTEEFYRLVLTGEVEGEHMSRIDSEWREYFSDNELRYMEFVERHGVSLSELRGLSSADQREVIEELFDTDGPKPALWQRMFDERQFSIIAEQGDDLRARMGLTSRQLRAVEVWAAIEDESSKKIFIDFVMHNLDSVDVGRLDLAPQLLLRLSHSNASEIQRLHDVLAVQLLYDEDPLGKLNAIEQIFLQNHLPYIGKAHAVFNTLNTPEDLHSLIEQRPTVSPVLKNAPAEGLSGRSAIIFSDLLKSSFGSNNRSLRDWLESIGDGHALVERLASGEVSWDGLDAEQLQILDVYADNLTAAYNRTQAGLQDQYKRQGFDDAGIRIAIDDLTARFGPTERHSLPDRIVRSFAYPIGIRSYEEAVRYAEGKVAEADRRNREAASRGVVLEQGDLVKGIGGIKYLSAILQNGSVAREFLGDSAGSDATPLDTDCSRVPRKPSSLADGINGLAAYNYGPLYLVLKGDDRFEVTRQEYGDDVTPEGAEYDEGKLELFHTGKVGADHYGIRTGFASSEIDYIVTASPDSRIGFEIARNGFYIPVVDKVTGEVIFTPEDYDALRAKMSGLSYYGVDSYDLAPDIVSADVRELAGQVVESERLTEQKRMAINAVIQEALSDVGLELKEYVDGDLTPGSIEMIDTGSTGRGTNMPGDGDFDFMMRVDKSVFLNKVRMDEIKQRLQEKLGGATIGSDDFRLKGVQVDGLEEPVDIDITFVEKTNKLEYSSDRSVGDRLDSVWRHHPEQYEDVVANILLAKKTLKAAGAYKPNRGDNPQGGMGGIGIESWVLQNGGSFKAAAREFLTASSGKTFAEFKDGYHVWDFGENYLSFRSDRYPHDNFVNNMSEAGFEKMKAALKDYLQQVN